MVRDEEIVTFGDVVRAEENVAVVAAMAEESECSGEKGEGLEGII